MLNEIIKVPDYNINDEHLKDRWCTPSKRIYSSIDIPAFHNSQAIVNINSVIAHICSKISLKKIEVGLMDVKYVDFEKREHVDKTIEKTSDLHSPKVPNSAFETVEVTPVIRSIVDVLDQLIKIEDETPPLPGPRRYGNFAFRDWHDKVSQNLNKLFDDSIKQYFNTETEKENYDGFKDETSFYLKASFGSRERMDYGTGHELAFVSFIGCFLMSGLINPEKIDGYNYLIILSKYYDLIKSMILRYTLEPAGSHGVWGLDDHFHLAYVFGACQLIDYNMIGRDMKNDKSEEYARVLNHRMGLTPSSILNTESLKQYRTSNLYYNAIAFIRKVKTGAFQEHSPMLYEISSNKSWEKVARGMIKMYYGEVLSKFPVVQHFYFGGVFYPWIDISGKLLNSSEGVEEEKTETLQIPFTKFNEPQMSVRGSIRNNNISGRRNPPTFNETTRAPWARR